HGSAGNGRWSYHRERPEARTREGRSMMKRFIIGMLILGGIIATAAVIMKRRSGAGVGLGGVVSDTAPCMTDTATDAAGHAKDVAKDAAARAEDVGERVSNEAQEASDQATETIVNLAEEAEQSTT